MEPSGRVDDDDVDAPRHGRPHAVEHHGGRVGALLVPHESAPVCSAQTSSCSMAAARKVSAATSRTRRPAAACMAASLPIVVVFPTPFTPVTSDDPRRRDDGAGARGCREHLQIASASAVRSAPGALPRAAVAPRREQARAVVGHADIRPDQHLLELAEHRVSGRGPRRRTASSCADQPLGASPPGRAAVRSPARRARRGGAAAASGAARLRRRRRGARPGRRRRRLPPPPRPATQAPSRRGGQAASFRRTETTFETPACSIVMP